MWDKSSALLQFSSSALCQGIQRIFLSFLAASCGCSPVLSPSARAVEGDDQPLHAGSAIPTWKSFSHAMLGLCCPVKREKPC